MLWVPGKFGKVTGIDIERCQAHLLRVLVILAREWQWFTPYPRLALAGGFGVGQQSGNAAKEARHHHHKFEDPTGGNHTLMLWLEGPCDGWKHQLLKLKKVKRVWIAGSTRGLKGTTKVLAVG